MPASLEKKASVLGGFCTGKTAQVQVIPLCLCATVKCLITQNMFNDFISFLGPTMALDSSHLLVVIMLWSTGRPAGWCRWWTWSGPQYSASLTSLGLRASCWLWSRLARWIPSQTPRSPLGSLFCFSVEDLKHNTYKRLISNHPG